ncbi:MAG: cytochrome c3 family protein [Bacillota bacterium]
MRWPMKKALMIFAIVVPLSIVVIIGLRYLNTYIERPGFCAGCHENRDEYSTWKVSSHSQFGCLTCHSQPGLNGTLASLVNGTENLILHYVNKTGRTLFRKSTRIIPSERCLGCHTLKRIVTPSGDLTVPHAKHVNVFKVKCLDCHVNVVHGQADVNEEKGQAGELPPVKINAVQTRPSMSICMKCHDGEIAPNDCQICHKKVRIPDTHADPGWKTGNHGGEAKQKVRECLNCHAIAAGNAAPKIASGKTLGEIVRANDFCWGCHLKRPPGHDEGWSFNHRERAQVDRQGCLVCHQEGGRGQVNSSIVQCAKCHNNEHGSNWLKEHPVTVRERGISSCFRCHQSTNCSDCHTLRAANMIQQSQQ